MQLQLIEPTGRTVADLALKHAQRGDSCIRAAEVAKSWGWQSVELQHRLDAAEQHAEAECLAMLADFERLAGLAS